VRGGGVLELRNRFGEPVEVERRGAKVDLTVPLERAIESADRAWRKDVDERIAKLHASLANEPGAKDGRWFGPADPLPPAATELIDDTLERAARLSFADLRYLAEHALPALARKGEGARAAAIRVLTELRKRVALSDLGGKSLSSVEYLIDGGRARDGAPEGGLVRLFEDVRPIHEALADAARGGPRYARVTIATRDDLAPPVDPARDVLVIDYAGYASESFGLDSASRFTSEAVRLGWRHVVGYGFIGGPRYVGTNLCDARGQAATGVTLELYGREFGDFIGALLEGGTEIWVYGQGQSHLGMKADAGYLFVLQDSLNTCMYAAHGGTISVWDSGSRFAAAGQNKIALADGKTPAGGFKSIHFGCPNEYAFEYLMAGGDNSLHVVMGLRKPDARGELTLKPTPYAGKFFMSGAAAGRVFVFDPNVALDPDQYRGNVLSSITPEEWANDVAPFVARESRRRGLPIRIDGDHLTIRLDGQWRRWRYDEAFARLIPIKVAKASQQQGVAPPALVQIVGE
jgi:glutamate synthase domain-containing protein 3